MTTDMQPIIRKTRESLAAHCIAPGQYRRWTRKPSWCDDSLGINAYGCADAANILYTIGEFPQDDAERSAFVRTLHTHSSSSLNRCLLVSVMLMVLDT